MHCHASSYQIAGMHSKDKQGNYPAWEHVAYFAIVLHTQTLLSLTKTEMYKNSNFLLLQKLVSLCVDAADFTY